MIVAPAFPARYRVLPCVEDPELFQPGGYSEVFTGQIAAAKAVCLTCPALADCHEWAVRTNEPHGIWGATTPVERIWIRRKRGLPVPRLRDEVDL